MQKRNLVIEKNARFFWLGQSGTNAEELWIVCHGYAQLADEFLESFRCLDSPKRILVAPEGLHRFYPKGSSGRVAASWMTREERLSDISDYVHYLDQVHRIFCSENPSIKRIVVLGFSQGAATVRRWAMQGNSLIDQLILWCGFFPPDMPNGAFRSDQSLLVVTAENDRFITKEDADRQVSEMRLRCKNLQHIHFNGEHVIDEQTLVAVAEKINL
jgi:dienelactone hydrolase